MAAQTLGTFGACVTTTVLWIAAVSAGAQTPGAGEIVGDKDTKENIARRESRLAGLKVDEQSERKKAPYPRRKDLHASDKPAKLSRMVIPLLQLNDAPVTQALKLVADECQRLDQFGDGVELAITPRAAVSDARITMNIQNIPAIEALKYITRLADLEYAIRPDGLVLIDTKKTKGK